MNNELILAEKNMLDMWLCETMLADIKKIYGKDLTDIEFKTFINVGKLTGLNPFLKELWAIKYGNEAAQIFIGRDGYRKSAQDSPAYDYHFVDAVYSKDEYQITNSEVSHKYNLADRGFLAGAYCIVKRKNSTKPHIVYVKFTEYNTGKSLWGKKPETMIKKVAEAQCLRMAFQELFANTYDESEMFHIEQNEAQANKAELVNAQLQEDIIGLRQDFRGVFNYCNSLQDLKEKFDALKILQNLHKEDLAIIVKEKDKRKFELENNIIPTVEISVDAIQSAAAMQLVEDWKKDFDGITEGQPGVVGEFK